MKQQLIECKELLEELLMKSVEVNNAFSKLSQKNEEDITLYPKLVSEDQEVKEVDKYLMERQDFLFGVIKCIRDFDDRCK